MSRLWVTPRTPCSLATAPDVAGTALTLVVNAPVVVRPPYDDIQVTSSDNMTITRTARGAEMVTDAVDRSGALLRVEATLEADTAVVHLAPPIVPLPVDWVADPLTLWALIFDGCITMHAAAVTFGADVVIFTGFHNAGKSTAAQAICTRIDGAAPLADDHLVIGFEADSLSLCAGYADELAGLHDPVTCARALIVVLGEPAVDDPADTWLTLTQFIAGLGFEASTTALAADGLGNLLARSDVVFAPARDSAIEPVIEQWLHQPTDGGVRRDVDNS